MARSVLFTGTRERVNHRNLPGFFSPLGVVLFFLLTVRRLMAMDCLFLEDAWDLFRPWFSYLANSLAAGRFPLWDPHSSCGFPFHANPQTGAFYPAYVMAAFALGGGYKVFQTLWLAHWLFAIVGFFFLLKKMDLSPLGAFVGSLTFGFSGFFIANAEHTVFINVVSYVPWILLALDVACEKHLAYVVLAGALLGLAGLSGDPGIFCTQWSWRFFGPCSAMGYPAKPLPWFVFRSQWRAWWYRPRTYPS